MIPQRASYTNGAAIEVPLPAQVYSGGGGGKSSRKLRAIDRSLSELPLIKIGLAGHRASERL